MHEAMSTASPQNTDRTIESTHGGSSHSVENSSYLPRDLLDINAKIISAPLNHKMGKRRHYFAKQVSHRLRPRTQLWKNKTQKEPLTVPRDRQHLRDIKESQYQPEGRVREIATKAFSRYLTLKLREFAPIIADQAILAAMAIDNMANAPTWRYALQSFYLYAHPKTKSKIWGEMSEYITAVFGTLFTFPETSVNIALGECDTEDNEDESDSSEQVSWLELLRNLKGNWSTVKTHPLFSNISKLFGVLCYVGIVGADSESWYMKLAEAMMPGVEKQCRNSNSLMEALIDVTEYIASAAAIYKDTGSLERAIADGQDSHLMFDLARVSTEHDQYKIGLLEEVCNKTEPDHYEDVCDVLQRLKQMMLGNKNNSVMNQYIGSEIRRMEKVRVEVEARMEKSPQRRQPFGVYFNGKPGCGKSHLTNQVAMLIQALEGHTPDARNIYIRCIGEKYFSRLKNDHQVLVYDDVGLVKDDQMALQTADELVRATGIAWYYPPMSDNEEKGKVCMNQYATLLQGNGYMPRMERVLNSREAMTRRYPWVPYCVAKKEFCDTDPLGNPRISPSKIKAARRRGDLTGPYDDVMDIYMHESYATERGFGLKPVAFGGQHKYSVNQFMKLIARMYILHRDKENENFAALDEEPVPLDLEDIANDTTPMDEVMDTREYVTPMIDTRMDTADVEIAPLDTGMRPYLYEEVMGMENDYLASLTPEGPVASRTLNEENGINYNDILTLASNHSDHTMRWANFPRIRLTRDKLPSWIWKWFIPKDRKKINESVSQNVTLALSGSAALSAGVLPFFCAPVLCVVAGLSCAAATTSFFVSIGDNLHSSSMQPRDKRYVIANWKKIDTRYIAGAAAGIIVGCQLWRTVLRNKDRLQPQSKIEDFSPTPLDDPHYRALGYFPWNKEKNMVDKTHLTEVSKTTISDDLAPIVARQTYTGNLLYKGASYGPVTALIPCPGYSLIAKHIVEQVQAKIEKGEASNEFQLLLRAGPPKKGHAFRTNLNVAEGEYFPLPDTDVALIVTPETGDRKNLIKHFPNHVHIPPSLAISITRQQRADAVFTDISTTKVQRITVNGVDPYLGYSYSHPNGHYTGMCGSPIVTRGSNAQILGIHTAGSAVLPHGCIACPIRQQDLIDGIEYLMNKNVIAHPNLPESALRLYMKAPGFKTNEPHYKSALRYVTDDAQFTVVGTTSRRSKFVSSVKPNIIAKSVAKHCGVNPDSYYPPVSSPAWYGPQKNADAAAISGQCFPLDALNWAVEDLYSSLSAAAKKSDHEMRPLTDFEVINGTGRIYEDGVNRSTVWGAPFHIDKNSTLFWNSALEEQYPNSSLWQLNDELADYIEDVRIQYFKSTPVANVFTSITKDEVHAKDGKSRTFEVAPTETTWFGRALTLKTSSFLRLHTTKSECCVGVNCHGPDAHHLYEHFTKFGTDRMIAGDFAKYDKRMPVGITKASLGIYKRLARDFWPENSMKTKWLNAYDAWEHDVLYPHVNYYGDIIQMNTGYWPSGIPITADCNGLDNSLIHRCVYYISYKEKHSGSGDPPPFQEKVALGTYGDDSGGSVSSDCDWFDMQVMHDICARYDIKYTAPDKSTDVFKFWPIERFDFLKRNFNRVHEVGCRLGMLTPESIYKPLCKVLWDGKHVLNMHELAAETINGSMFEAFNHGKDFYDKHAEAMIKVSQEHGLWPKVVRQVSKTFEERCSDWHEQYDPQIAYGNTI